MHHRPSSSVIFIIFNVLLPHPPSSFSCLIIMPYHPALSSCLIISSLYFILILLPDYSASSTWIIHQPHLQGFSTCLFRWMILMDCHASSSNQYALSSSGTSCISLLLNFLPYLPALSSSLIILPYLSYSNSCLIFLSHPLASSTNLIFKVILPF